MRALRGGKQPFEQDKSTQRVNLAGKAGHKQGIVAQPSREIKLLGFLGKTVGVEGDAADKLDRKSVV